MKGLLCIWAAQEQSEVDAFTIFFTVCFFILLKRFFYPISTPIAFFAYMAVSEAVLLLFVL